MMDGFTFFCLMILGSLAGGSFIGYRLGYDDGMESSEKNSEESKA